MAEEKRASSSASPFHGIWGNCSLKNPEECVGYILYQKGNRVCGTWHYDATHQLYDGRIIAKA